MADKTPTSKTLSRQLKSLSTESRKLLTEYSSKHFEYLSYKDFSRLLKSLENITTRIEKLSDE